MVEYRLYTEAELSKIQQDLVAQNQRAIETAKKRGYKRDPRIEKANLK